MSSLAQQPGWLGSHLCSQAELESPVFRRWAERLGEPFRYSRILWDYCYVCQALDERGLLQPGKRGLGFAVGREPLASLFAALGCEVVATDMPASAADARLWAKNLRHATSPADLYKVDCYPFKSDVQLMKNLAGHVAVPFGLTVHVGATPAGFAPRPTTTPKRLWHPAVLVRQVGMTFRTRFLRPPPLPRG